MRTRRRRSVQPSPIHLAGVRLARRAVVVALVLAAPWALAVRAGTPPSLQSGSPPAQGAQGARATATPPAPRHIVIHAGRLIDGVSTTTRERVSIVIEGDRIKAVENGFTQPAGAEVLDLSTSTVLPGLIDAHTHITSEGTGNWIVKVVTLTDTDAAVRSTVYARRTLEAGFTAIRNVGASGGADVSLKRAIDEGFVPGPRIWTARESLSITGGHGDQGGLRPDLAINSTWQHGIVDSPEEAAKAVRYQHKYGADLIKFTATGGVLSIGDSGDAQQFNEAEMRAIVETAHLLGMKVAAHAHGKRGIDAAIRAGVDSIEHGTYLDDESIALFKKHGTYLVPTVLAGKTVAAMAKIPGHLHPTVQAKAAKIGPLMQEMAGRAYRGGVKMAFGTDTGVSNHGENAREFAHLVEAGVAPRDAILMATRHAAELIGAADRIGSIQPGRHADVIAVAGDPLRDVSELERVTFVMKGGQVVRGAAGRSTGTK
jgi:imidazolonepropionase-like amidohydrolase